MRFLIAILPLDTFRAKAQHKGGEIIPITTMLRRYHPQEVDAATSGFTQAQQDEINAVKTELEGRLSTLAAAGNSEAVATCNTYAIPFTPTNG
jgi:hypothetical protein